MNKLAFRLIFNRHRGMLMAVAETARACGGGLAPAGRARPHPASPDWRRLGHRVSPMLACLYLAFPAALAQIVADPNAAAGRRPLVEASANGLPLVRIARPSAAGVSHNQYSKFNIDARGMVLNNAATITQTRQAGLVDGNPNLSAGSARIILNEVTGTTPSQLLGHAEVAGSKAEVVIANPNGISCNGCGFINTSRAMLSTGTPVIGPGGELDSLRVGRGQVRIGTNGLDASELDQLDLIARSVEINGRLWGKQLSVTAGANLVTYAGLAASVIEGHGERPVVAIDLGKLGGMYGDKIRLIGTEAGVGVNTDGMIAARAGDLVIDSRGRLRFGGAVSAAGGIRASSAGMLENSGTLYGTAKTVLATGDTVLNSGIIASGGDVSIAAGSVDASGALAAGVHADGSMAASGRLSVDAAGRIHAGGRNRAAGNITFHADSLDLAGASSEAGGMLTLNARGGDIALNNAQTVAGTRLAIQARQGTVRNDASGTGSARMEAAHIEIDAQSLSNRGGLISQTGNEPGNAIHLSGQLDNSAGTIVGNAQDFSIASAALLNNDGAIRHAGTGTLLARAGTLQNRGGSIAGNGTLDMAASSLDNRGGTITSATDATLTIAGDAFNQGGRLAAGATMSMEAASLDNSGGQLYALGKQLKLTTGGLLANAGGLPGSIASKGNAIIRAGTLRNGGVISAVGGLDAIIADALDNGGGRLLAGGLLHASAGAIWRNAGGVVSGNQLHLAATGIDNRKGAISQSGSGIAIIDARSGLLDNSDGLIEASADRLSLSAGALRNETGAIRHAGTGLLKIETGDFDNTGGTVATNGQADIRAADAGNAGTISAARDLSVEAASLRNDNGILVSGGDLTVRAGSLLANAGGSLRAGDAGSPALVRVSAERVDNRDGQISAASLELDAGILQNSGGLILQSDAAGHAVLDVRAELDNRGGDIAAAAHDIKLTPAGQFRNDGGSVIHTGSGLLALGAQEMSNDAGALRTNGQIVLHAAHASNRAGIISAVGKLEIDSKGGIGNGLLGGRGGTISGDQVILTMAAGKLDNAGGTVESASGLAIQAGEVGNDGGLIVNRGTAALTVDAGGMTSNRGGSIVALGELKLGAGGIDNRAGLISAQGDATITSSAQIANGDGVMQSWGRLAAKAATVLDNADGKLRALGQASTLDASGASLVNDGGLIVNAGQGLTSVSGGMIVNANPAGAQDAGLIGGNGDLLLSAGTLQNMPQAAIVAGGDMTLAVTGLAGNSGKLIAGRKLLMRQAGASMRNTGGEISAPQIDLATASVDNSAGVIANPSGSGGNVTIRTGQLVNPGGRIGSDRDLLIVADRLSGKGSIVGGRDADVRLQGDYTHEAGNLISANRELRLSTTGMLTNAGILSAADSILLDAAGLVNLANAVIASGNPDDPATGLTRLIAAGGVDNAGRIEGNRVDSRSGSFHNRGSVLGDLVSIRTESLDNDGPGAVMAATSSLDLWVRNTLSNRNGGTLFSLGDINMAADEARDGAGLLLHRIGLVNNLSSTVEAAGDINLAAELVNNVRENIRTETVKVADATFTLNPLPWWTPRAPGRGAPERNSNTNRLDAYYLDPKAILSDEAMLTPDGYVIHKATVKLSANDSAFQWMVGGLTYPLPGGKSDVQYGSQLRITPASGTRIIYYINRRDNEANPDQVANINPWADKDSYLIRQVLGSVSYSGDYGNCSTNCVRLETLPGYTDPTTQMLTNQRITREGGGAPGVYPVEVQRKAHQTITETRLAPDSGQAATIASGGAMQLQIGTLLNNDNGQIAAGGNLLVNGQAVTNSASQALVRNTGTRLERTYTFENQSGFGSAMIEPSPPVEWVSWRNPSITQPIGTAGGTITSNQAVVIDAGKLVNQTVARVDTPSGVSPLAIGLGEDVAVYAGSAADRRVKPAIPAMPGIVQAVAAAAGTTAAPLPGAVRMVDGARAGALSPTLPTSGLYRIAPQPERRYLVETDPRFTNYRNFISSDYMLQRLGIQPERMHKRLGDGFYEQRMVLAQATAMTGKRFLDDYASAEEEYIGLMTDGVAFAQRFNLTPGIALSDQQMSQLTSNIVWLVDQTVTLPDGSRQTVLTPQVYLARNAQLAPTGALVAGNALGIRAGDVDNTGSTLQANNALVIQATRDIDNSAGAILGGNVALQAGNNMLARSLTGTERSTTGRHSSSTTSVTAVSRIAATGGLAMSAGGDLNIRGAQVTAGGDLMMQAGRSLSLGGVEIGSDHDLPSGSGRPGGAGLPGMFGQMGSQSTYRFSARNSVGSSVAAGGTLRAFSAGAASIEGSQLSAGADLRVAAQGPVDIVNSTGSTTVHRSTRTNGYSSRTDLATQTVTGSKLAAGGQVSVHAGVEQGADGSLRFNAEADRPGSDLTLRGSSIVGGRNPELDGKVTLGASGRIDIDAAGTGFDFRTESRQTRSGLFSTKRSHDVDTLTAQAATGSIVSGSAVRAASGGDLTVRGSAVAGSGPVSLSAGGHVIIEAARESSQEYHLHERKKSGIFGNGIGVTVGSRSQRSESQGNDLTESDKRSLVGSSADNVVITAGKDAAIRGSDLVAGRAAGDASSTSGHIDIRAQNIAIDPGQDASRTSSTMDARSSGVTVALVGTPVDTYRNLRDVQQNPGKSGRVRGTLEELGASSLTTPQVAVSIERSRSHAEQSTSELTSSGSSLSVAGDIGLRATGNGARDATGRASDGDITLTGAAVKAGGLVRMDAERNLTLQASTDRYAESSRATSSSTRLSLATPSPGDTLRQISGGPNNSGVGAFPYAGATSRDSADGSASVQSPSVVSGQQVMLSSRSGDIRIAGSAVNATGDIDAAARLGRIDIVSGEDSRAHREEHSRKLVGDLGRAGGTGTANTIGIHREQATLDSTGNQQNTIRSQLMAGGDLRLDARDDLTVQGADLLAGGNLSALGRNIVLDPGQDSSSSRQTSKVHQAGVTLSMSGYAVGAAQAIDQAAQAYEHKGDRRVAALYGAKATLPLYNGIGGAGGNVPAASGAPGNSGGAAIKATVSIGSKSASSRSEVSSMQNHGSTLTAGQGVTLIATGNGGTDSQGRAVDGDILASGARIAGNNVLLSAARDIVLQGARDSSSQSGSEQGSSGGIGVGFGVGGQQNGFTLELAAGEARSRANGASITHRNTEVTAAETVLLQSGGDTRLAGAQVRSNRVSARVGGDLDLASMQDSDSYRSASSNAGFAASLCIPPFCYGTTATGSAAVGKGNTDSTYRSVVQQSGIYAGQGGFDITVKGNTGLTGAVIASAAEADKNRLTTGTLTTGDLQNKAEYSAGSMGVSLSTGGKNTVVATPNVGMASGDSAAAVTKSAVSPGTVVITDEAAQQVRTGKDAATTVATLNRDTANANGTIEKIFDQKKVQQQQELARLVGDVGNQAVGTVSQKLNLADGSPEKMALHAAVGALQAGTGGGNVLAGATSAAAGEYVLTQVSGYLAQHPELTASQRNAIQQWAAVATGGAVGAVIGGKGAAQAGAAAALDGERYNRQLHVSTYERLKQQCRGSSSSECQTINRMGGVRSGMPTEDARIPASKVVENYDANGKVVSYTLIDAKSNQPTMIMEPLEFNAYRNAPPGTQALMQLSPQYALDFASAGLYSAAADNQRVIEHVTAGVTSRDYVRDVGLGVAGAAASMAVATKPSAAPAPKNSPAAPITADPLLPDADFVGRGTVRADLQDHLVNPQFFGKQISGGHDMNQFDLALNKAGGTVVSKVETGPGIYEIQYQLPNANKPAVKTVFDPVRYPDMESMAKTAANRALLEYQLTGNTAPIIQVKGINFDVRIAIKPGESPSVRTAFPVGSAK